MVERGLEIDFSAASRPDVDGKSCLNEFTMRRGETRELSCLPEVSASCPKRIYDARGEKTTGREMGLISENG